MERTPQEKTDVLIETVEQLAPLVEAGLPGRNAVAFAFRQGWPYPADDVTADDALMVRAIEQFRRLPAGEKRRICNGWAGDPTTRPTRRELEACDASLASRTPAIVLSILGKTNDLFSCQQWEFSDFIAPVEVRIRFGASKADVLRSLRDIEGAVRDFFEVMIGQEFTNVTKVGSEFTKGKSKTLDDPRTVAA